jgi:hypothetical protein
MAGNYPCAQTCLKNQSFRTAAGLLLYVPFVPDENIAVTVEAAKAHIGHCLSIVIRDFARPYCDTNGQISKSS